MIKKVAFLEGRLLPS